MVEKEFLFWGKGWIKSHLALGECIIILDIFLQGILFSRLGRRGCGVAGTEIAESLFIE